MSDRDDRNESVSEMLGDVEAGIETAGDALADATHSLEAAQRKVNIIDGETAQSMRGRLWMGEILEVLAREEELEWDYEYEAVLIHARMLREGMLGINEYEDLFDYLHNATCVCEYSMFGNRERAEPYAKDCERVFQAYVTWFPCLRFPTVGLFGAGLYAQGDDAAKPNATEWHKRWRKGWGERPEDNERDA